MDREPDLPPMSENDFFAWAEHREGRYELVEGAVMMHAGATRDHERVAKRIFALLYAAVDEARFDVNKGDFGVRIRPGQGKGSILYPDVVVDRQSQAGEERATMTPIVVVEGLSASTDYDHHVEKLARYARRDTTLCLIRKSHGPSSGRAWTLAGRTSRHVLKVLRRRLRFRPSGRASRCPRYIAKRTSWKTASRHLSSKLGHSHKIYYGTLAVVSPGQGGFGTGLRADAVQR